MTTPRSPFAFPAHWQWRPSPNFDARRLPVTGIVLHADASSSVASSMDWCRRAESKVSYHVLIGRRGDVYALVRPERRAWHAGKSAWDGKADCNGYTIGVCLSNRNDGEPFPAAQLDAAAKVCAALSQHFGFPADRITTHAAVATPAGRKTDPKGLDLTAFLAEVVKQRE
jgi:N-acetylmuramoyl-L-alanine amidase